MIFLLNIQMYSNLDYGNWGNYILIDNAIIYLNFKLINNTSKFIFILRIFIIFILVKVIFKIIFHENINIFHL